MTGWLDPGPPTLLKEGLVWTLLAVWGHQFLKKRRKHESFVSENKFETPSKCAETVFL